MLISPRTRSSLVHHAFRTVSSIDRPNREDPALDSDRALDLGETREGPAHRRIGSAKDRGELFGVRRTNTQEPENPMVHGPSRGAKARPESNTSVRGKAT